jgi:hypothetical protein
VSHPQDPREYAHAAELLRQVENEVTLIGKFLIQAGADVLDATWKVERLNRNLETLERIFSRHPRELVVLFLGASGDLVEATAESGAQNRERLTMQIFSNDPKGLNLALAETNKGAPVPLSKGPFTIQISDPNGTVTVKAGSADQTTPTNFLPNGSGAIGTVTVIVTDTSVTPPLVSAPASFDVVAPVPPPPVPDALLASFVPAP